MCDHDDDTDPGLAGLSPEFQAMVGGMAGHTASFAKLLEKRSSKKDTGGYGSKDDDKEKDDEEFFESYADLAIHEEMLKDASRVDAYRAAIHHYGNEWNSRGDVRVVDVGSGTGLLAVLCARAGAKKVEAIEASRMAHFLREIVAANVQDGAVEVHECRAEDLALGEGEKVDVVVSEWMGYALLFENMLPSVLSVRDRYLKPGGLMLPSRCRLMIAPMEDTEWREAKLGFWRDVGGIDMSAIAPLATATFCRKPAHRVVAESALLADPCEALALDLATVAEADLQRFEAALVFKVPPGRRLDGFCAWFECDFGDAPVRLSTSPHAPPTHWRQTTFLLQEPLDGGGGVDVGGSVVVERHEEYTRGYRFTFDFKAAGRKRRCETFELR